MSTLTMLDRAMILAQHELEALNEGDIENAERFFMDRAEILARAYKGHDEENNEDYVFKLVAIQGYNQIIYDVGTALKEEVLTDLRTMGKRTNAAKSYIRNTANW